MRISVSSWATTEEDVEASLAAIASAVTRRQGDKSSDKRGLHQPAEAPADYSARSATIGSIRDARRAGK